MKINSNEEFADDIRLALEQLWSPSTVIFRGSFAARTYDEFSDIDLQANIQAPLNEDFYLKLESFLCKRYGPFTMRYDPDHKNNIVCQDLRISIYSVSIFWRVDLNIESSKPCEAKYPNPFPPFSIPMSAFWNIVWGVKYRKRNKQQEAGHYLRCACEKLAIPIMPYTKNNASILLEKLSKIPEINKKLIKSLAKEIT